VESYWLPDGLPQWTSLSAVCMWPYDSRPPDETRRLRSSSLPLPSMYLLRLQTWARLLVGPPFPAPGFLCAWAEPSSSDTIWSLLSPSPACSCNCRMVIPSAGYWLKKNKSLLVPILFLRSSRPSLPNSAELDACESTNSGLSDDENWHVPPGGHLLSGFVKRYVSASTWER